MPAQTLFIVQQFNKVGRRLVAGETAPFKSAQEAVGAPHCAVSVYQIVALCADVASGESRGNGGVVLGDEEACLEIGHGHGSTKEVSLTL